MKVYVFLADGFEEIEAVTIIDILRRAQVDVKSVSVSGSKEVNGAHGIVVNADMLFDSNLLNDGDMLVLPGGMPGATNLELHKGLALLLKEYRDKDKWLAAICAAPKVLGKMGLLKGKSATCYPGFEADLNGAECSTERVVKDGKIITSRGPGTAIEFSLKLVEVLISLELSSKLKSGILL